MTGWRSRESLPAARRGESDMATPFRRSPSVASRDIPFNKLVLSQSNVRRVKAGVSIEELAESIARRTPAAEPQRSAGARCRRPGDRHVRGARRAAAATVRSNCWSSRSAWPRRSRSPASSGTAASPRRIRWPRMSSASALHPLDQFRAFQTLRDGGMTEEEIAARHFVSAGVVKQRLRLASVSPKLLDVYAEDGMTLEQLMAFTVTADHARQEQVWERRQQIRLRRAIPDPPHADREHGARVRQVARSSSDSTPTSTAGGTVLRDLFEHDDGGWLQDVALLDRLVTEKLKAEAETIAAEGWKWIEVAVDFPYGHTNGLRELEGEPADLTDEEQATHRRAQRRARQARGRDYQDADELPDEVDQRLGEIEAALAAFEARSLIYDPAEIARAGVFVSIDAEGRLSVDRGYVRPEDEAPVADPESEDKATRDQRRRPTANGVGPTRGHHGRRRAGRTRRG